MRLTLMKGIAALSLVVAVGYPTTTKAAYLLTYSTTATINGSSGAYVFGNSSISFAGLTNQLVGTDALGTIASYGSFTTTSTTAFPSTDSLPGSIPFALTITQTNPAPTSGSPAQFTAVLTGTLADVHSNIVLTFDNPLSNVITFTGGEAIYEVPASLNISPPSTNNGVTTLQGNISAVPEPTTVAMAFTSLPILGLVWMRRRKQQA